MRFPQPPGPGEDDIAGGGRSCCMPNRGWAMSVSSCYAPLVAERGARVIMLVPPLLKPLMGDDAWHRKRHLPWRAAAGVRVPHCSLMSLPRAFRTGIDTIPAEMPLSGRAADRVLRWSGDAGDGRRRIALAWSGSDTIWNRAIPLAMLAPILARTDCEFHVAQTDIRPPDRETLAQWPGIVDHSADLEGFRRHRGAADADGSRC